MNKCFSLKSFFLNFLIFNSVFSAPIGQHFILSLPENASEKKLSSWLKTTKPAGVMLVSSHFVEREKTKKLITFLQHKAKELGLPPLFIAVDWEGGIISRPNETGGFFSVPSPWALANSERDSCFLAGMLIGSQLQSIGANMTFAPSFDLFDPSNQILATRCFSSDPKITAECGIAFAKGLLSQGVLPVIKHFPGLGLGARDTHLTNFEISLNDTEFQKIISPFKKGLEEKIPCLMATHAKFRQFDNIPTTLSTKAVNFLTAINPDVLLITDDFCMKAVQEYGALESVMMQALKAGYHLIIFSGRAEKQIDLIKKLQKHSIDPKNLNTSFIKKFKQKYLGQKVDLPKIDEKILSEYLAKRCITIPENFVFLQNKKFIIISVNLPKIRTPEKWFIQNGQSFLRKILTNYGFKNSEYILDPLDDDSVQHLYKLLSSLTPGSYFLLQTFFYADNKWNKMQKQWLEKLKPYQNKLIILSLGHPLEKQILPDAHVLNLGSFNQPLLKQVAKILTQKEEITGADKLVGNPEKYLSGKNFGLLCHKASCVIKDGQTKFLPDALYDWTKNRPKAKLAALFCPEHGLLGFQEAGAKVESEAKSKWGCPIYSLHGSNKKPTQKMFKNLDLIIIDLQEVGVRCFTYLSTLQLTLEAAQEAKISVLVLDRPNPLIELGTQGPMLEKNYESFLGKLYTKFLHGSTIGSLAKIINKKIGANLTVLPYNPGSTDIFFTRKLIAPSPSLSSINHIYAYPVTVFLEGTNYSEGRGTDYPFLQIGAPWVEKNLLAKTLNNKKFTGIYFEPITFTPQKIFGVADNPKHANKLCHGVFLHIYDLHNFKPTKISKAILQTLFSLYPEKSELLRFQNRYNLDLLVGKDLWRKKILKTKTDTD
jgi:uncharacterized protein YbbC (DUF1343 family)/beta-glucosidase-like glycosyl hydrolase